MLKIDSAAFVVAAAALVLGLWLLPRRWRPGYYLAFSAVAFVALLPGWPSRALAAVFVYSPLPVERLCRRRPRLAFSCWLLVQTAVVLWIRRYLGVFPWFSDSILVDHGLAVIGISYIILRQVEWLLWSQANPEEATGFVSYSSFVFGFLTLLAGPIIPYAQFRRSFLTGSAPVDARGGLAVVNRLVNGYIKVSLLSPVLGRLSTVDFVVSQRPSLAVLALFFYLYPLYIYLNFSGYCDVVIGLGGLVGFPIPENFRNPFFSPNVQEFWQRWHITFSGWVRTHVFYPLMIGLRRGSMRRTPALALGVATLLSFVFVGLWHGPTLGFLCFGVLHGAAVLLVSPFRRLIVRVAGPQGLAVYQQHPAWRVARVVICFHFLCLTIALFDRDFGTLWGVLQHALRSG